MPRGDRHGGSLRQAVHLLAGLPTVRCRPLRPPRHPGSPPRPQVEARNLITIFVELLVSRLVASIRCACNMVNHPQNICFFIQEKPAALDFGPDAVVATGTLRSFAGGSLLVLRCSVEQYRTHHFLVGC